MRKDKIIDALGQIDDDLIEDVAALRQSKRSRKLSRRIIAAASVACACLIAAVALWGGAADDDIGTVPPDGSEGSLRSTSQTYGSLEELLQYLSRHDYHADSMNAEGRSVNIGNSSHSVAEGAAAVAYENHAYFIAQDEVQIAVLDEEKSVGSIGVAADQLLLWQDRLIVVDSFESGGSELDREYSVRLQLYDLAVPAQPQLMHEYVQLGSLSACYVDEGRLFLFTADGQCACGWSRLSDAADYMPQLLHNDGQISWDDADISILGEPVSVRYLAAVAIAVDSGQVIDKQAFYGDIEEIFYGPQWLILMTQSGGEKSMSHPELYSFDTADEISYSSKLSVAELFGLSKSVKLADGVRPAGDYPQIVSVVRHEGVLRLVGSYVSNEQQGWRAQLLAIEADLQRGEFDYELLAVEGWQNFSIDDLLWLGDSAIVCLSSIMLQGNDVEVSSRFAVADFGAEGIIMSDTAVAAEMVNGVDGMYAHGNPFGSINSFIPLGNDLCLRYNHIPNALDILDFRRIKRID